MTTIEESVLAEADRALVWAQGMLQTRPTFSPAFWVACRKHPGDPRVELKQDVDWLVPVVLLSEDSNAARAEQLNVTRAIVVAGEAVAVIYCAHMWCIPNMPKNMPMDQLRTLNIREHEGRREGVCVLVEFPGGRGVSSISLVERDQGFIDFQPLKIREAYDVTPDAPNRCFTDLPTIPPDVVDAARFAASHYLMETAQAMQRRSRGHG